MKYIRKVDFYFTNFLPKGEFYLKEDTHQSKMEKND